MDLSIDLIPLLQETKVEYQRLYLQLLIAMTPTAPQLVLTVAQRLPEMLASMSGEDCASLIAEAIKRCEQEPKRQTSY